MLKTVTRKYRTALDLEFEILNTVNEYDEININSLMNYVNTTSNKKIHEYLDPLIDLGFINMLNYKNAKGSRHKVLKITEKGKEHLSIIKQYMSSIGK